MRWVVKSSFLIAAWLFLLAGFVSYLAWGTSSDFYILALYFFGCMILSYLSNNE